jgi:DNA-binding transcriptional LysR family regulator
MASHDADVFFVAERRLRDSSLVCRSLEPFPEVIAASPQYLARAGMPSRPEQLERHDIVTLSPSPARFWEFRNRNEVRRVAVKPFLSVTSVAAIKAALMAGLGIARLPLALIQSELTSGELCPLLENFALNDDRPTLWMVYSRQRLMPAAVRSFIDFTASHYRSSASRAAA